MTNEAMRTQWDGSTGAEWVRHERLYDRMLQPLGEELLRTLAAQPGESVLDVGSGFGTTSRAVQLAVGSSGHVHGIDISSAMVERARQRVPEATFAVGDAQADELGGPYDAIVSRFGVMFFDNPGAAFARLRGCIRNGGRLAFVCWQPIERNPAFTVGAGPVLAAMPEAPPRPAPGAPGPFGLADGERTAAMLRESGWSSVELRPFECPLRFDVDGGDGVEERIALIRSSEHARTLAATLPEQLETALESSRHELRSHVTDGVLQLPSATWFVTANA